jgi:hypothetical protein
MKTKRIQVPEGLYKEAQRIAREYPSLYASADEFVRSALREEILRMRHVPADKEMQSYRAKKKE